MKEALSSSSFQRSSMLTSSQIERMEINVVCWFVQTVQRKLNLFLLIPVSEENGALMVTE